MTSINPEQVTLIAFDCNALDMKYGDRKHIEENSYAAFVGWRRSRTLKCFMTMVRSTNVKNIS